MQLVSAVLGLLPLTAGAVTAKTEQSTRAPVKPRTVTTGATVGHNANRYEIRYLRDNLPYQWNLYLAAVQKMQTMDHTDEMSWYGIMGIHGYPVQNWGGVPRNGTGAGYCEHGVITFPPWHRPYVALYEQQLVAIAVSIAANLTVDRANYMDAATKLRAPFFDWGARGPYPNEGPWPELLSSPTIISNLTGTPTTISNPLYRYNFNPLVASDFRKAPYSTWPVTHRYPLDGSATTTDNTTNLTSIWAGSKGQSRLARSLNNMYKDCTIYADFATYSNDGKDGCTSSLEAIHGVPHAFIGGQGTVVGHMNPPAYAAFDPAFMLHHSNVDRLFAFWQTLNPQSYSASQNATTEHNYAYPYGTIRDMSSPLYPFYKDSKTTSFWTGIDVQDWRVFNYDYPEYNRPGATRSASDIRTNIQHLYSPGAPNAAGSFTKRESFIPTSAHKSFYSLSQEELADEFNSRNTDSLDDVRAHPDTGLLQRYILKVQTPKILHDNSGSFAHQFFFGEPANSDQGSWSADANSVGQVFLFMGVMPVTPETSADSVFEKIIYGSVPLDDALAQRVANGELASLLPHDVLPYLQKNLVWKISGTTGAYSIEQLAAGSPNRVPVVSLLHKEEESSVAGERPNVFSRGQIAQFANQTHLVVDN